MEPVQADDAEAAFTPRLLVPARHAQDAVFERWGDPVVDGLAWNGLN
jgi:hypothetical protein